MHSQRGSRICNYICSDSLASFLFALQEASCSRQQAEQAVSCKLRYELWLWLWLRLWQMLLLAVAAR